jgi:hypothetical protein
MRCRPRIASRARSPGGAVRLIGLLLFVAAQTFGTGCRNDFDASDQAIPDPIRQINDQFFRAIQAGDTGRVNQLLAPALHEEPNPGLDALSAGLAGQSSIEIKFGSHGIYGTEVEPLYMIESQASSAERFFLVRLALANTLDGIRISSLTILESPVDAEDAGRLRFSGLPSGSVKGLAAAATIWGFVLWCLIDCWRHKPRMRWLWIVAIAIGYPAMLVNWGTGQWIFSRWHIVPFGVWISQTARISPMIIQLGFPLGALLWFFVRSRASLASGQVWTETLPPTAGSSSAGHEPPETSSSESSLQSNSQSPGRPSSERPPSD